MTSGYRHLLSQADVLSQRTGGIESLEPGTQLDLLSLLEESQRDITVGWKYHFAPPVPVVLERRSLGDSTISREGRAARARRRRRLRGPRRAGESSGSASRSNLGAPASRVSEQGQAVGDSGISSGLLDTTDGDTSAAGNEAAAQIPLSGEAAAGTSEEAGHGAAILAGFADSGASGLD